MTKEEQIDAAVESMTPIPSSTKVQGWVFKMLDNYYTVLSYWMSPMGEHIAVFESNKKGKKTGSKDIVLLKGCKDPILGVEALAEILIKEETQN